MKHPLEKYRKEEEQVLNTTFMDMEKVNEKWEEERRRISC